MSFLILDWLYTPGRVGGGRGGGGVINILVFLVLYGKAQPLTYTVLYTFYLQMVPLSHTYL